MILNHIPNISSTIKMKTDQIQDIHTYIYIYIYICRSQWPPGLKGRFAVIRLLRSWVRIPPGAWMFVCCECCFFSVGLITRPEESWPTGGLLRQKKLYIYSLVFSPQAGFSRNQNPVRLPVWPWHTASWTNSQGQVAIAFPRLQTFPSSPLGAFTSNDARDLYQRKVELFVGEKCSDKFGLESDVHVILGIFYMPQICDMGQTALRLRIFSALKNPTASAGFEPANLGTKGQHANPQTTEATKKHNTLKVHTR